MLERIWARRGDPVAYPWSVNYLLGRFRFDPPPRSSSPFTIGGHSACYSGFIFNTNNELDRILISSGDPISEENKSYMLKQQQKLGTVGLNPDVSLFDELICDYW